MTAMAVDGGRPRIVLVVEDSDTCAALAELAISGVLDVTVVLVKSASDALRILRGPNVIEALITDLNMPRMDGFELIRAVRADSRFSAIPILVVSADTDPDTRARVAQLGANAFFAKPYSPALLRRTLEQLLNATSK